MRKRTAPTIAVLVAALAAFTGGCSDDVVCPEIEPQAVPFVSASVTERDDSSGTGTEASVFCTADPLPSLLIISISGRQVDGVGTPPETGLLRTLSDELVVWQPGASCSLNVTTDYGFASAAETVPSSPDVSAPAGIGVGESLQLSWPPVDGADYYRVSAVIDGASEVVELSAATRETLFVVTSDHFTSPGSVTGHVDAVAGPFIESSSEGNVEGDGSGFFTVSYHDASGEFQVQVTD